MVVYAPSQLLPALTAFVTTPILTRLFPPAEFGFWAMASSIAAFMVAIAVSGFGSAVIRFLPSYKIKSTLRIFFATIINSVNVTITIVVIASYIIFFLFKSLLPPEIIQVFNLIILIFVFQSIFNIFIAVLRANGQIGSFTTFQLLSNYGGLAFGLLFVVVFRMRIDGLLWGTILSLFLILPLLIIKATNRIGVHLKDFQLPDAKQIWQYAWPLTLGNVAMWGLRVSDLFIINLFRSDREVGLYSVSYNISAKSIELLVSLFLLSVSPLVYRTWESEGREATEKTLTMISRVYLLLCLPATLGLTILAFPFVALLTTPDYYEGTKIVGFVVFSSFAWGLSNIAVLGIAIKKKALLLAATQILAVSVHVGLQFLLVPRFGYVASAISTLIGYTVLLGVQTISSHPYLTWRFPFKTFRNVLSSSLVMGLFIWGYYGIVNKTTPIYLFISILFAIPVYIACLWLFGEITQSEKKSLIQLCAKLRKA